MAIEEVNRGQLLEPSRAREHLARAGVELHAWIVVRPLEPVHAFLWPQELLADLALVGHAEHLQRRTAHEHQLALVFLKLLRAEKISQNRDVAKARYLRKRSGLAVIKQSRKREALAVPQLDARFGASCTQTRNEEAIEPHTVSEIQR